MKQKHAVREGRQKQKLRHAPQPLNLFIAQEVYRVLLFGIFLAQVAVVRHVPYIGENDCSTKPYQQMEGCTFLCSELCKLANGKICDCQYSSWEYAEATAPLHLVTCCCLFHTSFGQHPISDCCCRSYHSVCVDVMGLCFLLV